MNEKINLRGSFMNILYGVNGVGNGHIARSREMAKELKKAGINVQFLFSGRPKEEYFDMEIFGDYLVREGLSFVIEKGKVKKYKTFKKSNFSQFLRDIDHLRLTDYDLIISDYEPITAWSAKIENRMCIGIGHQYAFSKDIPKAGFDFISKVIMKNFAPVSDELGLHWDSFHQDILPPIIDVSLKSYKRLSNTILVYLPFEDQDYVAAMMRNFPEYKFIIYSKEDVFHPYENVYFFKPSVKGFVKHLKACKGVICNSGFELVSECLHLGKKVLVKPVHGQPEQISNAMALSTLKYGMVMDEISKLTIDEFLASDTSVKLTFPNVAAEIVNHILEGKFNSKRISKSCWSQVLVD